jgi:hypothetical protein
LPAKSRSCRSGIRSSRIQGWRAAQPATSSSVPSVEPSLTTTQRSGGRVCATIERSVSPMCSASLRAGVIST